MSEPAINTSYPNRDTRLLLTYQRMQQLITALSQRELTSDFDRHALAVCRWLRDGQSEVAHLIAAIETPSPVLSDAQFRALLNLLHISPSCAGEVSLVELAIAEAGKRGFDGWQVAYREFQR